MYWYDGSPNQIWISKWTDDITAEIDVSEGSGFEWDIGGYNQDELDPFANWFGELKEIADQEQFIVHFQSSDDEIYYEVDSEATLWAHLD